MKQLIINTGDISDADGFLCISEYALTTNADILFIMNFPAYLYYDYSSYDTSTNIYESFTYGLKAFLTNFRKDKSKDLLTKYDNFLHSFGITTDYENVNTKQKFVMALIKASAYLIKTIFYEAKSSLPYDSPFKEGIIYFMIGGINTYNPFNLSFMKNEICFYIEALYPKIREIKNTLNKIYSYELITFEKNKVLININDENYENYVDGDFSLDYYHEIYLDGNGSCSIFYDENKFLNNLFSENHKSKIKGFFIMGGVINNLPITTFNNPDIHRVPTATMNQLYCGDGFFNLINLCRFNNIPLFVVPNTNIFSDPLLLDPSHLGYLLTKNSILEQLCIIYYTSNNYTKRANATKPFDIVTAKALVMYLRSGWYDLIPSIYGQINREALYSHILKEEKSTLFFNKNYAITVIDDRSYYEAYKEKILFTTDIFNDKDWFKNMQEISTVLTLHFTAYPCFMIYIEDCNYYQYPQTNPNSYTYNYRINMPLKIHNYKTIYEYHTTPNRIIQRTGGNKKSTKRVIKKLRFYKKQK